MNIIHVNFLNITSCKLDAGVSFSPEKSHISLPSKKINTMKSNQKYLHGKKNESLPIFLDSNFDK